LGTDWRLISEGEEEEGEEEEGGERNEDEIQQIDRQADR
jgi:hypothetical protein